MVEFVIIAALVIVAAVTALMFKGVTKGEETEKTQEPTCAAPEPVSEPAPEPEPAPEAEPEPELEPEVEPEPAPEAEAQETPVIAPEQEAAPPEPVLMGKYEPLENYLKTRTEESITLSFEQLETILGSELPKSAKSYDAWWSNTTSHSQAKSWLNAGYCVVNAKKTLAEGNATFVRK